MIVSTTGAQAAPSHPDATRRRRPGLLAGLVLATSVIGSLALAPAAGATSTTPGGTISSAPVALMTTSVDKPWYSVERYYLELLNCTRTGGWVLTDGTCRGSGSGHYSAYVAPITYSYGLSDKVTRPYAKLLVAKALCAHSADGDPGYRLRRAGYTRWNWGENVGCRDGYGTAKAAVLASQLNYQSEKSSNGGHWRNIKNPIFHWVGIGMWRSGTRNRLVVDFYG